MADNVIKVSVTSTKSQRVSVSSSQQATNITASPDTGRFWSQTSKNWAVSENIVDGEDYSSKYYANKSKQSEQNAEGYLQSTRETYNTFVSDANDYRSELTELKDAGAVEINEAVASGKDEINSAKTTIINDIEFVADGEKKEIEDLIDNGKEELRDSIGDVKVLTTLEIGDIGIAPLGIDETKGKRRYLNGQLIIQDQYVQFTNKVKSAVALYPSLACTEDEWQTTATMTVGGQVGKFVVDDEGGTIRLPKIIMPIQGLTDLSKLAEIVEAGLPNITAMFPADSIRGLTNANFTGAAYAVESVVYNVHSGGSNNTVCSVGLDASRSNPIYSNSNTVQQEQIQYPYFIQVATGAEVEDNIINEIELNNPFSFGDSKYSPVALNNLSWLKSEGQYNSKAIYPAYYDWALTNFNNGVEGFALSTDEYTDYDVVINPAEETFRLPLLDGSESLPSDKYVDLTLNASGSTYIAPANGWYYVSKASTASGQYLVFENLTSNFSTNWQGTGGGCRYICPVRKGDQIQVIYTLAGSTNAFRFIYAQGNGSLYFYVGETVQNANLINAGRIEEKVASLIPDNSSLISSYGMPSSRYIDLTLGASGSTYTMPSNGWLCCGCTGSGAYMELVNYKNDAATGVIASSTASYVGGWARASIPVSKGDTVNVYYGGTFTLRAFRFVYAQGSESEAN